MKKDISTPYQILSEECDFQTTNCWLRYTIETMVRDKIRENPSATYTFKSVILPTGSVQPWLRIEGPKFVYGMRLYGYDVNIVQEDDSDVLKIQVDWSNYLKNFYVPGEPFAIAINGGGEEEVSME